MRLFSALDAVAGAHGRNAEEFVDRVRDCGVDAMAARGARSPSMLASSLDCRVGQLIRVCEPVGAHVHIPTHYFLEQLLK